MPPSTQLGLPLGVQRNNNIANIINVSRIPAVHSKRDVPIPSEDQAVMVVRAVLDVIARMLLGPSDQAPE